MKRTHQIVANALRTKPGNRPNHKRRSRTQNHHKVHCNSCRMNPAFPSRAWENAVGGAAAALEYLRLHPSVDTNGRMAATVGGSVSSQPLFDEMLSFAARSPGDTSETSLLGQTSSTQSWQGPAIQNLAWLSREGGPVCDWLARDKQAFGFEQPPSSMPTSPSAQADADATIARTEVSRVLAQLSVVVPSPAPTALPAGHDRLCR